MGRTADDELVPGRAHTFSRLIFYLAILALVSGLAWACLTPVDLVIRASGQLTAEGGTIPLTVPKSGLVIKVHVKIGDPVRKGDPLIDLDPLVDESELDQLRKEIFLLELQIEGHRETARNIRGNEKFIAQKIDMVEKTKQLQLRELETYRKLAASGEITPLELNKKELEVTGTEIRIIELTQRKVENENLAKRSDRQREEETARKGIFEEKLRLLTDMRGRLTLRSPVDGKVVALAVSHPGSILGPGQPAAQILPGDDPIVAVILVANTQIRQSKLGMEVVLRLNAYPYQDFGEIRGKLSRIDPKPDKNGFFLAMVSFDDGDIPEKLKNEFLRPGLVLTAEIIGGRKKMIDFVLEPFQKLKDPIRVSE